MSLKDKHRYRERERESKPASALCFRHWYVRTGGERVGPCTVVLGQLSPLPLLTAESRIQGFSSARGFL